MDKQTFLKELGEKLLAYGVSKEDVDNQLSRFEKYFSKMGEHVANSQIDSLEDMDALARNVYGLLNPSRESEGQENEGSNGASEQEVAESSGTDEDPLNREPAQSVSAEGNISEGLDAPDVNSSDDEDMTVAGDDEDMTVVGGDGDMTIVGDEKATKTVSSAEEAELFEADTVNFDKVEYSTKIKTGPAEFDEELLIAETISFDAVRVNDDNSPEDYSGEETLVDLAVYADVAKAYTTKEFFINEGSDYVDAVGSDTVKFEKPGQNEDAPKRPPRFSRRINNGKKEAELTETEAGNTLEFNSQNRDVDEVYDGNATSEIPLPVTRKINPVLKENALLFWLLLIVTLPITLAAALIFVALIAAGFVGIAGLIAVAFALVAAVAVGGSFMSLFGIIFGIIQTFNVISAGIYEIGIGIIIGGAAMLLGVLIYNAATKLLPMLMKQYYSFTKSVLRKAWRNLLEFKKECVG